MREMNRVQIQNVNKPHTDGMKMGIDLGSGTDKGPGIDMSTTYIHLDMR